MRSRGVNDLALQVGQVHLVVVDDPDRADAGRGEIEAPSAIRAAGAEQEHLASSSFICPSRPTSGISR